MADDSERRFPDDTSVKLNYLSSLGALLAVKAGEPSQALALLDAARSSELGAPRATIHGYFGALYPVYVRGEAYLAAQQPADAATEFQKIIDHRGIVVSDPIGALAHLQIGTAYLMAKDKARAESSLHDFLDLWKDADSDIPLLKQAKAQYTNVQ